MVVLWEGKFLRPINVRHHRDRNYAYRGCWARADIDCVELCFNPRQCELDNHNLFYCVYWMPHVSEAYGEWGETFAFLLRRVACYSQLSQGGGASTNEAMSRKDAYMFPFIGSGVLFSLYAAFKFFGKEAVNKLLAAYFGLDATFFFASLLQRWGINTEQILQCILISFIFLV